MTTCYFSHITKVESVSKAAIFENFYCSINRLGNALTVWSEVKWSLFSVSDSLWPYGPYSPWNSPGQNTGVGSISLLQGIFQSQGLNSGLPHCRKILFQLSHKGSPRILDWLTYPSPGHLLNPGIKLGSPALQVDYLPTEAIDCLINSLKWIPSKAKFLG